MLSIQNYSCLNPLTREEIDEIAQFLFEQLGEYGDPMPDIKKSINFALQLKQSHGGQVIVSRKGSVLTGVVVINKTGMSGYIPENILVYIATHREYRGQGIGRQLMIKAIQLSEGDVALHVEPENAARRLYESLGFTNKYLEMRLKK